MKNVTLTTRQHDVLSAVREYMQKVGEAPTLKELAEKIDVKSIRTVTQHLDALEEKGYIRRIPNQSRNIRLVEEGVYSRTVTLPVMASAGCDNMSVEAHENYDSYMKVDRSFLSGWDEEGVVLIRAVGDSMVDAGIDNGSLVLTQKTHHATDGDLVVAIIDDMAVIKRIELKDNAIILHPESQMGDYQPIIMQKDFQIFGKVIDVLETSPPKNNGPDKDELVYEYDEVHDDTIY